MTKFPTGHLFNCPAFQTFFLTEFFNILHFIYKILNNNFLSAPQRVELSDEAKQKILQSQDFAQFFGHAARIIEKAICEEDYAFDYGAIKDDGEG